MQPIKPFVCIMAICGVALAATDAGAELRIDKETYYLGEPIVFTLRNQTDEDIMWSSISHYPTIWRQLEDDEEEVVRELPLVVLLAIGLLAPRDETAWEWDQRDYHQWYDEVAWIQDPRTQVEPGRFVGRFETFTHGTFETPEFEIVDEVLPVGPKGKLATTWGGLKTR